MKVIYDGWTLYRAPDSPAGLHLLALLDALPETVEAYVALPGTTPAWLPARAIPHVKPAGDTARERLAWEQRNLPQAAIELGADLLHLMTLSPPLFGRTLTIASPAGPGLAVPGHKGGFFERLREAAAGGGQARLDALLWPKDLPLDEAGGSASRPQVYRLPPLLFPAPDRDGENQSRNAAGPDLPEQYILAHGIQTPEALIHLLEVWSWAAGPVGEAYPLALLGIDERVRSRLPVLAADEQLAKTILALPAVSPRQVERIYQGCTALLQPLPVSAWGEPVRLALACGKPVVATETRRADALVGPAAYLIAADDFRAMGAAVITTIVEGSVAERLSQAAGRRAAGWEAEQFGSRLLDAYQDLLLAP